MCAAWTDYVRMVGKGRFQNVRIFIEPADNRLFEDLREGIM